LAKQFRQTSWDAELEDDFRGLLRLAVREDLLDGRDHTTLALVPEGAVGRAAVVARGPGIIAGLPGVVHTVAAVDSLLRQVPEDSEGSRLTAILQKSRAIGAHLQWDGQLEDGQQLQPGQHIGCIEGPVRGILMAERLVLNLLGHLSGIATLTRRYVDAVAGTKARIFDTRKTTPGWRRLEKYAVRCGGGWNHRTGLFEAVLIKDNHLAWGAAPSGRAAYTPSEAVLLARQYVQANLPDPARSEMIIEIEVDTLDQLDQVLPARPDIVLLDNMTPEEIREAVARRDRIAPEVELEASGGVTLQTVRAIAETGVDRISVGELTHSAPTLDLALDWVSPGGLSRPSPQES